MDLRQAAYVVAVVDHQTFTAAAASIPVSQPALSQAIATLERELGTELFHRIGRQVVLTPLVDLVGRFRKLHPGVLVRIAEPEDADGIAAMVRSGASELGLGDVAPDDRTIEVDHLGGQSLLAFLPPGTPLSADRHLPV